MEQTNDSENTIEEESGKSLSFFDLEHVDVSQIPVAGGVPIGLTTATNSSLGIGGSYGTWGESIDNPSLPEFLGKRLGYPLSESECLDLAPLGFHHRHHVADLSDDEHRQVEIEVGRRFLNAAIEANGWRPSEVEAVLIGASAPVSSHFTEEIARQAGIPESALKVSVHKACDSSVSALHLALNPNLSENQRGRNLARELWGKKILVGGIEGLSRFTSHSKDTNALQLFGNGAGVIGVIPGKNMQFLVGEEKEVYDEKGLLAAKMFYPHSRKDIDNSMVEVTQENSHNIRVAGFLHEPENGMPIEMAGLMGMVKLFVRSGVEVVRDVYQRYQAMMIEKGNPEENLKVTVVHHANYKINKLKAAQLEKDGIRLNMPWVLSEFGNVSAASAMIAFLRLIRDLKPGDHILFDGFGAGTYYDVFAAALGMAT